MDRLIYFVVTLMFIGGMGVFLFDFFRTMQERQKMQELINSKLNEKEMETAQRIAGEFLHQKLLNERLVPEARELEELEVTLKAMNSPQSKVLLSKIADLKTHMQETKDLVRNISRTIFPPFLPYLFVETCQRRLDDLKSLNPNIITNIHYETEGSFKELNPSLLYNLYNIMDLFVTNSLQHAQASNIYVSYTHTSKNITLSMHDDGRGFHLAEMLKNSKGIGLADIQGKATVLSPYFVFQSTPKQGTKFNISVPLKSN